MATITVGRENSTSIDVYYEDHGAGPPVVLIAGYPFSARVWEKQTAALLDEGHRVIVYDRRGFGRSSRPVRDYGFDTLVADLNSIMVTLDIRQATLVGHSMGTGEVVRYLATHGSRRVAKAVLISPLQPFLLKGSDNPAGIEGIVFERMFAQIERDRLAFVNDFLKEVFNVDERSDRDADAHLRYFWNEATTASPSGTTECLASCLTDFRHDLERFDVPSLVVAGGDDRFTPLAATALPLTNALPSSTLRIVEGAPHGLHWTHADEVNRCTLRFIDG